MTEKDTQRAEYEAAGVAHVQAIQALHRRILAAKDAGLEPDPADLEAAAAYNASQYSGFDRINRPDDY